MSSNPMISMQKHLKTVSKTASKKKIQVQNSSSMANLEEEDGKGNKKENLYKRIEKLKLDVTQKNMLRMENQSLKDMQKLLMNRLEQQDEYFNQCMYGKQKEVEQLTIRLISTQSENKQLRDNLASCQAELRKARKFIQYYPRQQPPFPPTRGQINAQN